MPLELLDDTDCWYNSDPDTLWLYDKLLVSRKLGYVCGPAGVPVPESAFYIVRPISNYRMMSRGADIRLISRGEDTIPDGFFWCEVFQGRHLSFDYHYGTQTLAVEGFRDSDRLDRFCLWKKVDTLFELPDFLQKIAASIEWLNIEVIGDKIIEIHFRFNDDFRNHTSDHVIPVWKDNPIELEGYTLYPSPSMDRIGFLVPSDCYK